MAHIFSVIFGVVSLLEGLRAMLQDQRFRSATFCAWWEQFIFVKPLGVPCNMLLVFLCSFIVIVVLFLVKAAVALGEGAYSFKWRLFAVRRVGTWFLTNRRGVGRLVVSVLTNASICVVCENSLFSDALVLRCVFRGSLVELCELLHSWLYFAFIFVVRNCNKRLRTFLGVSLFNWSIRDLLFFVEGYLRLRDYLLLVCCGSLRQMGRLRRLMVGNFRTLLLNAACIGRKFGVVAKSTTSKRHSLPSLLFLHGLNLIILVASVLNVSTRRFDNWCAHLLSYFRII